MPTKSKRLLHVKGSRPSKKGVKASQPKRKNLRKKDSSRSFQPFVAELGVFQRICEAINTPRSLACWYLAEENTAESWDQYLHLPSPIGKPYDVSDLADDYLVSEMMTKNPRLPLNVDRAAVALDKFFEAEKLCASSNLKFIGSCAHQRGGQGINLVIYVDEDTARAAINALGIPAEERALLHKLRSLLMKTLPRLTSDTLEDIQGRFRFGPGATSTCSGKYVLPSRKYADGTAAATPKLFPFALSICGPNWLRGHSVAIDDSVEVITVPKNAKTDRTIGIEPSLNGYVQLGIGSFLKDLLGKLGLSPRNQSRNRRLARECWKRCLCTVDLSMASDTISVGLLSLILPEDWKQLLNLTRTPFAQMPDGQLWPLDKVSSMGNGYTWELESLVFYAVVQVVTGAPVDAIGVFGDDLVFPAKYYPAVSGALEFLGFKVNSKKSFWQGDFFESCGKDYYRGIDVRPFYLKKDTYEDAAEFGVLVANAIRRYAHKRAHSLGCDVRFRPAWLYAIRRDDRVDKTGIPDGVGDDGLVKNFDEFAPAARRNGHEGFLGRVLHRAPLDSRHSDQLGGLRASLDKLEKSGERCGFVAKLRPHPIPMREAAGPKHRDLRSDLVNFARNARDALRVIRRIDRYSGEGLFLPPTPSASLFVEPVRGQRGRPQLRDQAVNNWPDLGPWI